MLDSGARVAAAFLPAGVPVIVGLVLAVMRRRVIPAVSGPAIAGLAIQLLALLVPAYLIAEATIHLFGVPAESLPSLASGLGLATIFLQILSWTLLLIALFRRLPAHQGDRTPTGRHALLDDRGEQVVAEEGTTLLPVGAAAAGAGAGAGLAAAAGTVPSHPPFAVPPHGTPPFGAGPTPSPAPRGDGPDADDHAPTETFPVARPDEDGAADGGDERPADAATPEPAGSERDDVVPPPPAPEVTGSDDEDADDSPADAPSADADGSPASPTVAAGDDTGDDTAEDPPVDTAEDPPVDTDEDTGANGAAGTDADGADVDTAADDTAADDTAGETEEDGAGEPAGTASATTTETTTGTTTATTTGTPAAPVGGRDEGDAAGAGADQPPADDDDDADADADAQTTATPGTAGSAGGHPWFDPDGAAAQGAAEEAGVSRAGSTEGR